MQLAKREGYISSDQGELCHVIVRIRCVYTQGGIPGIYVAGRIQYPGPQGKANLPRVDLENGSTSTQLIKNLSQKERRLALFVIQGLVWPQKIILLLCPGYINVRI